MSSRRGADATRSRPQKYQNKFAFKNDLHEKTPKMKMLNSLHVCEVCERCKAQIEWKIKYKKYKPLTKPKTCTRCQQRNIKKAYHVICRDCSRKDRICAKCLRSEEEVRIEPPGPTEEEKLQLRVEMDELIKSLTERRRRAFLRFMKKGKESEEPSTVGDDEDKDGEEDPAKVNRVPHTREALLKKIEELQLGEDDDEDDENFSSDDDEIGFEDYYD